MSKTTWLVIAVLAFVFGAVGTLSSGMRGAERYGATDVVLAWALVDGFVNGFVWAAILTLLCWIGAQIRKAVRRG